MTRLAAAAGPILVLAMAGALPGAAAPPSCRVESSVEPARAVVGQQVLYRARVHRVDEVGSFEWERPPSFPGFRTENLPSDPRPARSEEAGVPYRVQDEVRALFADREGRFTLRAPSLLCHVDGRTEAVGVPDVVLTIDPFPAEGRPDDFAGMVGAMSLLVTVSPEEIALGETLRVAVMARGTGNLWDLDAPLSAGDFGSAEVFERRPEREIERGLALFLRAHFVYDVVPRRIGQLRVPEIAIRYFDPESGLYRVARTEPVRVPVRPRAATAPPTAESARATPATASTRPAPLAPDIRSGIAMGLLALGVVAGAIWWRRRRPDRSAEARALARSAASIEDPRDRASSLDRAIRTALGRSLSDAASVTPEELLARPGLAPAIHAAARLLSAVERARFDPLAEPPDVEAALRVIADL